MNNVENEAEFLWCS